MPSLLCGFLRALKTAVRCLFPGLQATQQRRLSCLGLLNTELMKIAALCLGITWERAKLVATCSRDLQSRPLRKMIEVVVQIREGRLGLSSDGRSRASGEPGRRCRLCCRVPAGIPPVPWRTCCRLKPRTNVRRTSLRTRLTLSLPPVPASKAEANDYLDNAFASLADEREPAGEGPGARVRFRIRAPLLLRRAGLVLMMIRTKLW